MADSVRAHIDRAGVATPDAPFLITPDSGLRVTYRDLATALAEFADNLSRLGIRDQQVVSVMMQNSWGSVQVILGTLYGGRITAPGEG